MCASRLLSLDLRSTLARVDVTPPDSLLKQLEEDKEEESEEESEEDDEEREERARLRRWRARVERANAISRWQVLQLLPVEFQDVLSLILVQRRVFLAQDSETKACDARAFLLAWGLLLELVDAANPECEKIVSQYLQDSGILEPAFNELLDQIVLSFEAKEFVPFFARLRAQDLIGAVPATSGPGEQEEKEEEEEQQQEASAVVVEGKHDDAAGDVDGKCAAQPELRAARKPMPCLAIPSTWCVANLPRLASLHLEYKLRYHSRHCPNGELEADSATLFGQLACWLYTRSLKLLPVLSRRWYLGAPRARASAAARVGAQFISRELIKDEMKALAGIPSDEDFRIVGNLHSNEIVAKYLQAEFAMALVIRLPDCYPLKAATVSFDEKVRVSVQQETKWRLKIVSILSSQNGTIGDAVCLWKDKLDRHFEDAEECTICYSLIHPSTRQLPKMQCKQCKNKFHSACLYRWFNTSGKSQCPLCRGMF